MKTERELFESKFKKSHWVEYDEKRNKYFCPYVADSEANNYDSMWKVWQASAQREGYKLVPVEMHRHKADDLASVEWDKHKDLFLSDNRDFTALQVEEFRLRWCRNKAHQIMNDYKAMMGAADEREK